MPTSPSTPAAAASDPTADVGSVPPSPSGDPTCTVGGEDPHDHTGHDHGPTGSDIVTQLIRGLSIISLVIPVIAVVMLLVMLTRTPTTPYPLVVGLALGAVQLIVLVVTSMFVARTRRRLAVNPGLTAVRTVTDEVLRLAAVLLATLLFPGDLKGPLGIWVGGGVALVWLILSTAQTVSTRRRIASPSPWSTQAVETFLSEGVSVPRSMVSRVLDVIGTASFQLGATMLVLQAPLLVIGTVALSMATGLSTLVLQRRSPSQRSRSPWAFAPFAVGVLTLALALVGLATV
jgi:hypothetical protein